jgi:hypothetical protein
MSVIRLYIAVGLAGLGIIVASLGFGKDPGYPLPPAPSCEDQWGKCRQACQNKKPAIAQLIAICKDICDDEYTACIKKEGGKGVIQRGTSGGKLDGAGAVTSATPKRRLPTGTEPVVERSPKPAASPLRRAPQLKDAAAVTAEASEAPKRKPTPKPSPRE